MGTFLARQKQGLIEILCCQSWSKAKLTLEEVCNFVTTENFFAKKVLEIHVGVRSIFQIKDRRCQIIDIYNFDRHPNRSASPILHPKQIQILLTVSSYSLRPKLQFLRYIYFAMHLDLPYVLYVPKTMLIQIEEQCHRTQAG